MHIPLHAHNIISLSIFYQHLSSAVVHNVLIDINYRLAWASCFLVGFWVICAYLWIFAIDFLFVLLSTPHRTETQSSDTLIYSLIVWLSVSDSLIVCVWLLSVLRRTRRRAVSIHRLIDVCRDATKHSKTKIVEVKLLLDGSVIRGAKPRFVCEFGASPPCSQVPMWFDMSDFYFETRTTHQHSNMIMILDILNTDFVLQ